MKRKMNPRMEDLIPDPVLRKRVTDQLYSGGSLFGQDSVFSEMLQAMVNAALEGEVDHFIEEQTNEGVKKSGNRRNGHIHKTVRSEAGPLSIKTPRDRLGDHEPMLIKKRERELRTGMDEIIISLYARGNSISDIQRQLMQLYGVELSEGLISSITDRVMDEITAWQQRTLNDCYAIIYLDAVHYRTRQDGSSQARAVHTVYGVTLQGERDILGLYVFEAEGSRGWVKVLEDIQRRGVEQVFFFCVDGLKGFKDAIKEMFPMAIVQRCIVHKVRRSVRFVSYNDLKKVCTDLRKVYTAANREMARQALDAFANKWNNQYPEIAKQWLEEWDDLMAFMDFTEPIRRMIYTTNPVEAVHRILRKVTKTKGTWPNDHSLLKQLYLALKYNEQSWKRKAFHWIRIQQELISEFGNAITKYLDE
jgi:putative transposase